MNRAAREVIAASEGRETEKARRFRGVFSGILEAERDAYRETANILRAAAGGSEHSGAMLRDAAIVDAFADSMKMPQTDGDLVLAHLQHLASRPTISGIEAFEGAALSMVRGSNGEGWRIMTEQERAERYTPENMAAAIRERFEYTELAFKLEKDPAKRAEYEAELGQEKIRLASAAERPEWAEEKNAAVAFRPAADKRQELTSELGVGGADGAEPRSAETRLAVAASDASEARILADADRQASSAFEGAGIDPELALQRIRYEGPVDRATARQWRGEEIAEAAQTFSISEDEAQVAVDYAHQTARQAYENAAKELRRAAPTEVPGDVEDARAVLDEQEDMKRKAERAEDTARQSRGMKL